MVKKIHFLRQNRKNTLEKFLFERESETFIS